MPLDQLDAVFEVLRGHRLPSRAQCATRPEEQRLGKTCESLMRTIETDRLRQRGLGAMRVADQKLSAAGNVDVSQLPRLHFGIGQLAGDDLRFVRACRG